MGEHEISRRRLLARSVSFGAAAAGLTAVATACGTLGAGRNSGRRQLSILQWAHFVPAYDEWFDDFAAKWGQANNVDIRVDHIASADIPARMAAEVAARGGHDMVEMQSQILTYLYESQLLKMDDIVAYARRKYGEVESMARSLAYVGGRWLGMPNFMIAISPQIRQDLFRKYGFEPDQVKTWEDYLQVGAAGKRDGHAAGVPISHCDDANRDWRSVMWSFGAHEVGGDGRTITVDSQETRDFLTWAQKFYAQANVPDVFAWDNASDNKWLASGMGVWINDAISSMRAVQATDPGLYAKFNLRPPIGGPAAPNGISVPDNNIYTIWKWSRNQDTAKEFLASYVDHWMDGFAASQLYNQPVYANFYQKQLFTDPAIGGKWAEPQFGILQSFRGTSLRTYGWPGPPNYSADLVMANFVIPDMVAHAVKSPGLQGVKDAIAEAKSRLKLYYS